MLENANAENLRERLGEPYWTDADETEIIDFFEFDSGEIQVEYQVDGQLKRMILPAQPLMANADQREAYGVTKSWPPK